MRRTLGIVCLVVFIGVMPGGLRAQKSPFPEPEWFKLVAQRPPRPSTIPSPEHLKDYVVNGKLRLTLEQSIQLALANSTAVRIDELTYQSSANNILAAYGAFDPVVTSSFGASRSSTPESTALGGASVLSSLSQTFQSNYFQQFQTGTTFSTNIDVSRSNSNNSFNTFNPSIPTQIEFSVSQPLLRNFGLFPNRAPILIARRNLHESRMSFEEEVSSIIQSVVSQYWVVVLARESLEVDKESVAQAQASYDHDKRALELGALGPYDIFQSESNLASRKVTVTQADYSLRESEDALRLLIGADIDSGVSALDLDLVESSEPTGELVTADLGQIMGKAHVKRPEYEFQNDALAVDDMEIRLAHNQLLPSLSLSGFYSGSGLAGNQLDTSTTPPTVVSAIGLGTALGQAIQFTSPTYGFNLSLTLPIRNRPGEATLATTEISKRRDLYGTRLVEENIQLEARNAVNNLEVAKLSLAQAKVALDLAKKNLEGEQKKYELGTVQIFELLQIQLQLTSAEQAVIQAQVSYQLALVALDHATGEILEHHNVQIKDPKPY